MSAVTEERAPFGAEMSPVSVLCLLFAAVLLGAAVLQNNGAYDDLAIKLAFYAFAFAFAPVLIPKKTRFDALAERALPAAFIAGLVYQVGALGSMPAGIYLRYGVSNTEFHMWLAAAALVAGFGIAAREGQRRVLLPLLVLLYVMLAIWLVKASPAPHIDVWSIHQESARALIDGKNPYTITFKNPYGSTAYFSPGAATNERLLFGYVYPPWCLLAGVPGFIVGGDYRYGYMASVAAAAMAVGLVRGNRLALGAIAIWLFMPRSFFVLEQGWTEASLAIPFAAALVFAALKKPAACAASLGVLACAKQYTIIAAPAILLLAGLAPTWKERGKAVLWMAVGGGLSTLPFALRDFGAYWKWVYGIQFSAPFRNDSLSASVWWFRQHGAQMTSPMTLGGWLAVTGLVVWRAPRTPAGFAWAVGTIYFAFFMLRQGFCNYYWFVIATYALAMALAAPGSARAAAAAPEATSTEPAAS